jgi:hypothetical protein
MKRQDQRKILWLLKRGKLKPEGYLKLKRLGRKKKHLERLRKNYR